jgi:hypothetical protein
MVTAAILVLGKIEVDACSMWIDRAIKKLGQLLKPKPKTAPHCLELDVSQTPNQACR